MKGVKIVRAKKGKIIFCVLGILLGGVHISQGNEIQELRNEIQKLKKERVDIIDRFAQTLRLTFETCDHWDVLNQEAAKYWRDPSPVPLKKIVDDQVEKIKAILEPVIQGDEKQIKTFLEGYLKTQCDYLLKDFKEKPRGSFTVWLSSYPSQYIATLTYEMKAAELGLYWKDSYHRFYTEGGQLSPSQEQLIEDLNLKNKPLHVIPAPPLMVPLLKTHVFNSKIEPRERTSPLLNDRERKFNQSREAVLEAVRNGVPLRKVTVEDLKKRPRAQTSDDLFKEQWSKVFEKMRVSMYPDEY